MKSLLFIPVFLFLFTGLKAQTVKVGADKSFDESLNNYSTFGWSDNIDQIPTEAIFVNPDGVYIFNNESTRAKIKEAIKFELNAKGFTEATDKPDLLVIFEITEQPGKLETFNGYEVVGGRSVRTDENKETVDIQPGTLLINILDRKSGKVAWQGYASGILKPDMVNNDVKVREAVSAIFKEFKFQAAK